VFGQLLHSVILQPENLESEYIIEPDVDRRTKAGKELYADFLEGSAGKTVISLADLAKTFEMRDAMLQNELAVKLLGGAKETPFFWTDSLTGEPCKCRTDVITEVPGQQILVDVKSCGDASTEAFVRDALKYGYDVQAQMYLEGVKANTGKDGVFIFLAVEKEPPYALNIIQADKLFLQSGWSRLRDLMAIYHDCKVTGNWYSYTGKHNIINNTIMPAWALKEIT